MQQTDDDQQPVADEERALSSSLSELLLGQATEQRHEESIMIADSPPNRALAFAQSLRHESESPIPWMPFVLLVGDLSGDQPESGAAGATGADVSTLALHGQAAKCHTIARSALDEATQCLREDPVHLAILQMSSDVTSCYREAASKCPQVILRESPPAQFLAYAQYKVCQAADRLAAFWRTRLQLFGANDAFVPMLQGLTEAERNAVVSTSHSYILRSRDKFGRPVLVVDRSTAGPAGKLNVDSYKRVFAFLSVRLSQMAASSSSSSSGRLESTVLTVVSSAMRGNYNGSRRQFAMKGMSESTCFCFAQIHVVVDVREDRAARRNTLENVTPILVQRLHQLYGAEVPIRIHSGSQIEVLASLQEHAGLTAENLPEACGGTCGRSSEWVYYAPPSSNDQGPAMKANQVAAQKADEQANGGDGNSDHVPVHDQVDRVPDPEDCSHKPGSSCSRPNLLGGQSSRHPHDSGSLIPRIGAVPDGQGSDQGSVVSTLELLGQAAERHEEISLERAPKLALGRAAECLSGDPVHLAALRRSNDDGGVSPYREAATKCPELILQESPPRQYLMYAHNNVDQAADRLAAYWRSRLEVFGPSDAFVPLLKGLSDAERTALMTATHRTFVLPSRDSCGRPVLAVDKSAAGPIVMDPHSYKRVFMLISCRLAQMARAPSLEATVLTIVNSAMRGNYNATRRQFAMKGLSESTCFRFGQIHVVVDVRENRAGRRNTLERLTPIVVQRLHQFYGADVPIRVHSGTQAEVLASLQEHAGLTAENLPVACGGTCERSSDWVLHYPADDNDQKRILRTVASGLVSSDRELIAVGRTKKSYDNEQGDRVFERAEGTKKPCSSDEPSRVARQKPPPGNAEVSTSLSSLPPGVPSGLRDLYNNPVHLAMTSVADTSDYFGAVSRCPSLILGESPPSQFLKFCQGNAFQAAERLAKFWRCRRETFGPEDSFVPVQAALSDEEKAYLSSGFICFCPRPDTSGRPVVTFDRSLLSIHQVKQPQRPFFHVAVTLSRLAQSSPDLEVAYITIINSKIRGNSNRDRSDYIRKLVSEAGCFRLGKIHLVVDVREGKRGARNNIESVAPVLMNRLEQLYGAEVPKIMHSGTPEEVSRSLQSQGVDPEYLPPSCGGSWICPKGCALKNTASYSSFSWGSASATPGIKSTAPGDNRLGSCTDDSSTVAHASSPCANDPPADTGRGVLKASCAFGKHPVHQAMADILDDEEKGAYMEATERCPLGLLILRDQFLEFCNYKPIDAAKRLCLYWNLRRQVLGTDDAFKPQLEALTDDDRDALLTGSGVILPRRDSSDPPVLCLDRTRGSPNTSEMQSRKRLIWFLCEKLALMARVVPKMEAVLLTIVSPSVEGIFNKDRTAFVRMLLMDCMCVRVRQIHFVADIQDNPEARQNILENVAPVMLKRLTSVFGRDANIKIHAGSPADIGQTLQECGLEVENLPIACGGTWQFQTDWMRWLEAEGILKKTGSSRQEQNETAKREHCETTDGVVNDQRSGLVEAAPAVYPHEKHPVHQAMKHVEGKCAYMEAVERCPHLLLSESPPDQYLAYCHGYALEAAQRLAAYWTLRRQAFGEQAFAPLIESMTKEDKTYLATGYVMILPQRDAGGRPVLSIDRSRDTGIAMDARKRMMMIEWQLLSEMAREAPNMEATLMTIINTDMRGNHNSERVAFTQKVVLDSMCFRLAQVHAVVDVREVQASRRSINEDIAPVVLKRIATMFGADIPIAIHEGSREEVLQSLQSHGLQAGNLPTPCGGTLTYEKDWSLWLARKGIVTPRAAALSSDTQSETTQSLLVKTDGGKDRCSTQVEAAATPAICDRIQIVEDQAQVATLQNDHPPANGCSPGEGLAKTNIVVEAALAPSVAVPNNASVNQRVRLSALAAILSSPVHQAMKLLPSLSVATAYLRAVELCPQVVASESPQIHFHAHAGGKALLAAQRLANYWTHRVAALGLRDAFRPFVEVMTPSDYNLIKAAACGTILPVDASNRIVLCLERQQMLSPVEHSSKSARCDFFLMQLLFHRIVNGGASPSVHRKFGIQLILPLDLAQCKPSQTDVLPRIETLRKAITESMCLRVERVHFCFVSVPPTIQKASILSWLVSHLRLRHIWLCKQPANIHVGSASLVAASLQQHGMQLCHIPTSCGGSWSSTAHWQVSLREQVMSIAQSSQPQAHTEDCLKKPPVASLISYSSTRSCDSGNRFGSGSQMSVSQRNSHLTVPPLPPHETTRESASKLIRSSSAEAEASRLEPDRKRRLGASDDVKNRETPDSRSRYRPVLVRDPCRLVGAVDQSLKLELSDFDGNAVHDAMVFLPRPARAAYMNAATVYPSLLAETPHEQFLTFCDHDAREAAKRLAQYWSIRVEVFGESRAFLPLAQALSEEDKESLCTGARAILPRDSHGRAVIYSDLVRLYHSLRRSKLREGPVFFILHKVCHESWFRTKGSPPNFDIVTLSLLSNAKLSGARLERALITFLHRLTKEAFCGRVVEMHFVSVDPPEGADRCILERAVATFLPRISEWMEKNPSVVHMGTMSTILASLQRHGFDSNDLPVSCGGSWTFAEWQAFLSQCGVGLKTQGGEGNPPIPKDSLRATNNNNAFPPAPAASSSDGSGAEKAESALPFSHGFSPPFSSTTARSRPALQGGDVRFVPPFATNSCQARQAEGIDQRTQKPPPATMACPVQGAMRSLPKSQVQAYLEAMIRCPHLVMRESDPRQFQSFFSGDAVQAAKRLAKYWQLRLEFFGPLSAFQPLAHDALTLDERKLIESSGAPVVVKLPAADQLGRPVLFVDLSRAAAPQDHAVMIPVGVRLRAAWFYLHSLFAYYEEEEEQQHAPRNFQQQQQHEVVTLLLFVGENVEGAHRAICQNKDILSSVQEMIRGAFCARFGEVHLVHEQLDDDDRDNRILLGSITELVRQTLARNDRDMDDIVIYPTSRSGLLARLESHGLSRLNLPTCLGGSWKIESEWKHWWRNVHLPPPPSSVIIPARSLQPLRPGLKHGHERRRRLLMAHHHAKKKPNKMYASLLELDDHNDPHTSIIAAHTPPPPPPQLEPAKQETASSSSREDKKKASSSSNNSDDNDDIILRNVEYMMQARRSQRRQRSLLYSRRKRAKDKEEIDRLQNEIMVLNQEKMAMTLEHERLTALLERALQFVPPRCCDSNNDHQHYYHRPSAPL